MRRIESVGQMMLGLLVVTVSAGAGCTAAEPRIPDEGDTDGEAMGSDDGDAELTTSAGVPDPGPDAGDTGQEPDGGTGTDGGIDTGGDGDPPPDVPMEGMVLTMTNADDGNAIVAFRRDGDGMLAPLGQFITGGDGSGGGLGSQGALVIGDDGFVYAVNAGDGSVSSLKLYDDHLALVDQISTGGDKPTSVTVGDGRVYVLNAAGAGSVAGFEVDEGVFVEIADASQPLSGAEMPAPAQIGLTPDGKYLVVTERATNQIVTYDVGADGGLGAPVVNPSEGQTPFGFDFTSTGVFVVSEAFGGGMNPGASAASSYRVSDGGGLWTYTASAPSGQTAACWLEIVGDRFAYTTNTASDTISAYELDDEGQIDLFAAGGVVVDLGDEHSPLDMAISDDEAFLYVLNAAADNVMGYAIADDGSLTALDAIVDIPASAVGLAGF